MGGLVLLPQKNVGVEYRSHNITQNKKYDNSGGGGVIVPQSSHSDVNLSHKYLYYILQLRKEAHSLDLLSDMVGLWYYILAFTINI